MSRKRKKPVELPEVDVPAKRNDPHNRFRATFCIQLTREQTEQLRSIWQIHGETGCVMICQAHWCMGPIQAERGLLRCGILSQKPSAAVQLVLMGGTGA